MVNGGYVIHGDVCGKWWFCCGGCVVNDVCGKW